MKRIALGWGFAWALALAVTAGLRGQEEEPPNPELQRQEIINMERESAYAIQIHNGTYFRRTFSDDFHGVMSFGLPVNKEEWIRAIESPEVQYDSFITTEINVRLFQSTAVATCLWTWRGNLQNKKLYSQVRVLHVYVNGARGLKLVATQLTPLPPYVRQALYLFALRAYPRILLGFSHPAVHGGRIPVMAANRVLCKEIAVVGVFWGSRVPSNPFLRRRNAAGARSFVGRRQGLEISATYRLCEAPRTMRALAQHQILGKAVLVI